MSTANALAALTGSSTLRYALNTGDAGNMFLQNSSLNTESVSGDLLAHMPTSVFGAAPDFVYPYSIFGAKGGDYAENDGYEEWADRESSAGAPKGCPQSCRKLLQKMPSQRAKKEADCFYDHESLIISE